MTKANFFYCLNHTKGAQLPTIREYRTGCWPGVILSYSIVVWADNPTMKDINDKQVGGMWASPSYPHHLFETAGTYKSETAEQLLQKYCRWFKQWQKEYR